MDEYDPYAPRQPRKGKKDGKPKGMAKPEELPPEVTRRSKGDAEPTIRIRTIIRLRKKDQAERQEEEAILDLYKAALGMA